MIAAVSGRVLSIDDDACVIDAAGVGYLLAASAYTLRSLPAVGQEANLLAHMVVRDDAINLYGFATGDERSLFLQLISVSGVGPKVALAALSSATTSELRTALANGDTARVQAVPGIGKRTAERLIVELRERVGVGVGETLVAVNPDDPRSLARHALAELGYAPEDATAMVAQAVGETPEQLVATALRSAA